jgi:hypothetical protein
MAAAVAAACVLAWKIIGFAFGDALAARDPEAALWLDGAHPTALAFLVQQRLAETPADLAGAAEGAARLLERDPLAPGALSLFGAVAARQGETARAGRMFRIAAAHLSVDLIAHGALYDRALASRDGAAALAELDILLRARPVLAPQIAGSVGALLALGPSVEQGFADLLSHSPPWRLALLDQLATRIEDARALARLHGLLRAGAAPPSVVETHSLLERLLRDRDLDQAYLAWLESLPQERLASLGLLYNGGFRFPLTDLPFDWQIAPVRGAAAFVTETKGEAALKVEFYDTRVAFRHVRHLLTLPAGRYAFSGSAAADHLQTDRGLRWRVACFDDPWGELAATPLLEGTRPPQTFRVTFDVPAENCTAQILVLELPARIDSERQISGAARYSRLDIERLAAAAP